MAFCEASVIFPYFTVSRMFRDNASMHYAFIGLEMSKQFSGLFKNMSNGNIPNKTESVSLKEVFGDYNVKLWTSIIEAREPLIFVNCRIWTDDTIFDIKTKIFTYLSRKEEFLLTNQQELWMNINNKDTILGFMFEKENSEIITYSPSINDIPKIDNDFVTDDDERSSIILRKEDEILLFDTINKITNKMDENYNPRIFLYFMADEINWIKNNPVFENEIPVNKKRLFNGYFLKYWPFAPHEMSQYDSNLKLYTSLKNQVGIVNEIVSSVRESHIKQDPNLEKCVILKMVVITRPPKIENAKPYRLNMIYNFLRTLRSEEIPLIYYTSYGDKVPKISIDEPSLKKNLKISTVKEWIFKKLPSGKSVPRGRSGIITIKIYNYTSIHGIPKYITVILQQNSEVIINLSFEESEETSISNIETSFKKITQLIETLNNDFLIHHNHPLYDVPKLTIKNNNFIFSENTDIQFYSIKTYFKSNQIINFNDFSKFINNYKPFVDISFFKEDIDEEKGFSVKYNRISDFEGLPLIFEFINKEVTLGTRAEVIVGLIVKRFGKSPIQSANIYNEWRILKTDKQVAKELLKHPGVKIDIGRAEDFEVNKKYNSKSYFRNRN